VHEFEASALTAHLEVGAGEFQGHKLDIAHNTVRATEALGELVWSRRTAGRVIPFAEFGMGAGELSKVTINEDRHFSSKFQFTEVLRAGVLVGPAHQVGIAIGAQHYSNAGLSRPNDGITYAGLIVAWHWR
jgi:lipid A 3-O-deacylase